MIESIGYTEDGQVWIRLILDINGERMSGVMQMTVDAAKEVRKSLNQSIKKVEEQCQRQLTH